MKILFITPEERPLCNVTKEHLAKIRSVSSDIDLRVVAASNISEIERHVADAEVMVGIPKSIPDLSQAKNLKWVHSFSAGMDRVLTPELVNSLVLASNSAGIHATPIAEHIIAFLLTFTRKLKESFEQQQQKKWQRIDTLTELRDKIILIVGLGHIGREAARLAASFGARVVAVDTPGVEKPEFVQELGTIEALPEFLGKADFVVLCLPYTKDTHHFINQNRLSAMQPHAVLLNIGRGGVVDEQALIKALKEKKIGGAALDVTEQEPLPKDSPLWDMDNVVITPHHSGISEKYMDRAVDLFCLNLQAYLKGERLPNLIDKTAGY
ncbi:MAG: Uncharacterized protein Greene071421_49 [Parcubacteria group bacterium Greene0714_21]|nr:MAG: Uncharacterized protein Greene041639_447 [Parcubacteria group bacterium Greene0416_39]TSC97843.1 MAG: Uncharacterized protein Greene101447_294 [Parcubacteria group bacterium Greene1014_47]TSD04563.1 MAG: Uncharacterized protein Greene071421_49 [Parcubacteria group bacterium Greene0714_21]